MHAFYQFSLGAFVTVFCRGLDHAPGAAGRKGGPSVTLRQLQKRVSGEAPDFDKVMKKAKRRVSATQAAAAPGACAKRRGARVQQRPPARASRQHPCLSGGRP